jgi:hypothetical protein
MAIFSLALRTAAAASSAGCHEIIAASNQAFKLLEWGITLNAATATTLGMGTPAAIGTTPTSAVKALQEDTGNSTTAFTTAASAWATAPTTPTAYSRRVSLPASIGAGIIWTFPRGVTILSAKTWAAWNIGGAAMSASDVWFVLDE